MITGASKGLGRSLALAFAAKGYDLVIHGRDQERLAAVCREVSSCGSNCHIVAGDLSRREVIDELIGAAADRDIDILINNAGTYARKPIDEMAVDELRQVLEVNLIAPMLLTRQVLQFFKQKSAGLIINMNSIAGKNPSMHESVYCASKHGLRGFMGSLQFESLKYNVPIIDVYLGAMNTEMTSSRADTEKFIRTDEVADLISNLEDYASMRINEINILRRVY